MNKVIGLGNALVDIMTQLENDAVLAQFDLPKGSMQLVDDQFVNTISNGTLHLKKQLASGGSAANTIHGLANLGAEVGFMGSVGNDEMGNFFKNDLHKANIKPILNIGNAQSGLAVALVSQDGERTFATFLGAAVELTPDFITEESFKGYDILHIEGYLVFNQDLIVKALQIAKKLGMKVSLDLASYNVVEATLDFLKKAVKESVDIVFANEEEAKAFTGLEPEEALNAIAEMCEIAVVKIGSKGSLIKSKGETYKCGVIDVKCLDTTGAGDLYASGFLYGLINNRNFNDCGKIGAILSGNVIEVIGAKISESKWNSIRNEVQNICKAN
ncbi:MAG: adenosine kinase [Bacteroidota bacterium]